MCSFIFFISTVVLHPGRFHSHDPSASQQSYLIRNNKSAQFVNIYFNVFVAFTFGHTLEPNQHFTVTWCTFLQISCASSLSACKSNKKNLHNVYIALQKQNKKKQNRKKTRKAHQTSLDPLKPLSCWHVRHKQYVYYPLDSNEVVLKNQVEIFLLVETSTLGLSFKRLLEKRKKIFAKHKKMICFVKNFCILLYTSTLILELLMQNWNGNNVCSGLFNSDLRANFKQRSFTK